MNYGGYTGIIEIVDWNSNILFTYQSYGIKSITDNVFGTHNRHVLMHHDISYNLENDSIFVMNWVSYTFDECVALGRDPAYMDAAQHIAFEQMEEVKIGNLIQLRHLYLNTNKLTGKFPSQLGNLKNLEELCLFSNKLTGKIPSEIRNFPW